MRRIVILVGVVALLTVSFAAVAFARDFQCTRKPCYGTSSGDKIFERGGQLSDVIYARDGDDDVFADLFSGDIDRLWGQQGDDLLDADDGDGRDTLRGGPGLDVCRGDSGDAYISCEVKIVNGVVQ